MGKGLGIATLIIAALAIIIPLYGIYLGLVTAFLGIGVAALKEKELAIAIGTLNILNAVFLTPSLKLASEGAYLFGRSSDVITFQVIFWLWVGSAAISIVVALLGPRGSWKVLSKGAAVAQQQLHQLSSASSGLPEATPRSGHVAPPAPTAVQAAAAPALAPSYGSLQCTAGPLAGRRFEVTRQGLLIGRDPSKCQIVVPDEGVSREHAWVVATDEGVVVIDRGSSNGTYVNSVQAGAISKVRLQEGDRVFIGPRGAMFTYSRD